MPRKNKFGGVKGRPKETQTKELRQALTSALKGRVEKEVPLDDVYWKIKTALNK